MGIITNNNYWITSYKVFFKLKIMIFYLWEIKKQDFEILVIHGLAFFVILFLE